MVGRLPAAMRCLSFLLVTAAPLHALAQDERPIPPLPIGPRQTTASDHARALSKMADTAARNSAKCQSSGAALGSQAYKKCRALLEDKMGIENDVLPEATPAAGADRPPKNNLFDPTTPAVWQYLPQSAAPRPA
jgi:hypothetical protein